MLTSSRYAQRHVAVKDSRACFICYKPTDNVMANNSDFFYACEAHLKDRSFAVLDAASQQAEAERSLLEKEISKLRAEWEIRGKDPKVPEKAGNETKLANGLSAEQSDDPSVGSAGENKSAPDSLTSAPQSPSSQIKWYELNLSVLNLRNAAKKRAAQQRKTREMLSSPNIFPSVPTAPPK